MPTRFFFAIPRLGLFLSLQNFSRPGRWLLSSIVVFHLFKSGIGKWVLCTVKKEEENPRPSKCWLCTESWTEFKILDVAQMVVLLLLNKGRVGWQHHKNKKGGGWGFSPVRNTRGPRSSGWLMLRKYILKVAVLLCLSWATRAETEGWNGKCMFLVCWIWWRRRLKYGQIGWFMLKHYIFDLKQFNLSKSFMY